MLLVGALLSPLAERGLRCPDPQAKLHMNMRLHAVLRSFLYSVGKSESPACTLIHFPAVLDSVKGRKVSKKDLRPLDLGTEATEAG